MKYRAEDLLFHTRSKGKECHDNPIYANNLALQAIAKLKDAIDCLETLLG